MNSSGSLLRVAIVDDHKMFAEGFNLLLRRFNQVGIIDIYHSGEEFLMGIEKNIPDVAFMDIGMKELNGIETTKFALGFKPDLKVVALSINDDSYSVHAMIEAGVKAYITKNLSIHEVKNVFESIEKGIMYITPEANENYINRPKSLIRKIDENNKIITEAYFTDREINIIKLLSIGKTDQEIADVLFVSKKTIENEKRRIKEILGVENSMQIVVKSIGLGIVQSE